MKGPEHFGDSGLYLCIFYWQTVKRLYIIYPLQDSEGKTKNGFSQ